MSKVHVLLTGASSDLGQRLAAALASDERVGSILALVEPGVALPSLRARKLSYQAIDLTHERAVKHLLLSSEAKALTHIMHLAMHRDPNLHGRHPHRLNVDALRILFSLAEEHPRLQHFIFRSWGEIYELHSDLPTVLDEDHPIDFSASRPQWLRDRVAADQFLCAKLGISRLKIRILRCADCLAPGYGSQLYAFLSSTPCMVPLGYDPVVNVLSPDDLVDALKRACFSDELGVFTIPGSDSMPLSDLMDRCHRAVLPLPGPILNWVDRVKHRLVQSAFRYDISRAFFHYGGVMTGVRAQRLLGYEASHPINWRTISRQLSHGS